MTTQTKTERVTLDTIIREARAARAAEMRASVLEMYAMLKQFIAGFRPIRAQTPRRGAVA